MAEKTTKTRSGNPVVAYFSSAIEEFSKVTWPTKEQAALLTGIVVAVSLVTAILIGAFDLGLAELYKLGLKALSQ
ncbi:MAG: preprotein translocase subunit SecE [Candidatus Gracilibacteria bacterium]|jgi:preprotein translocase SecE subunit